jgi:GalNAc-alpha-(1->4)-GalNAc-alpha-(1->3)-diNAcBac-PP-undecaprenol alpha-1,4-N-acetyl-D-galactosaminyltransferase
MIPKKNKKTLAFVIPTLQAGGMERVMTELANQVVQRHYLEIHMIMFGKSPEIFYDIDSKVIIHTPQGKFNDKLRTLSTIKRIIYLRRQIMTIKPDVILSFGELWNNFVLLALLGLSYPVVVSDRCKPDKSLGKFHDFLRNKLYPNAKTVIIQTKKALDIYKLNQPKSNISVIGNPINVNIDLTEVKKENIIITVGRLINTKHHDRLINIFLKLNAPGWKLVIIGGNALKQNNQEYLAQIIEDNHANDKVILTGSVKNVNDYYKRSKIFAFTSSSEGFPNVIGEAMAHELPVVAYDCIAGPSEMIVDSENGFLIPLFDDNLFQIKLQYLIDNSEIAAKMGKSGREYIKRFSSEKIIEKFLEELL